MNIYDVTNELCNKLRESEEVIRLKKLKEIAMSDETNALLIKEYKRLQTQLQMGMISGQGTSSSDDMQRFQQISTLLMMNNDVQNYLLAEMSLQKTLLDVFKALTEASGIEFVIPNA